MWHLQISFKCSTCGEPLQVHRGTSLEVEVDPCGKCLDDERAQAFDEIDPAKTNLSAACRDALALCRHLESVFPEVGGMPSVQDTKRLCIAALRIEKPCEF